MFRDPGTLFTWYHSPALYVVPDWLLSGMLFAMEWSGKALPLIYASSIFALYAFAAGYSLSLATLERTYGKPQQIAQCDGQAAWLYDRSIS